MNSSVPIDKARAVDLASVGSVLQQTREQQEKTRGDAVTELNLRMEQLDALEHNQFDRLPGDAFVRGYLRSYAKWLDLDSEELIEAYLEQTGLSKEVSQSAGLNARTPVSTVNYKKRSIGAGLVVSFMILGFWLYNSNRASVDGADVSIEEIAVDTFSGEPLEASEAPADPAQNWKNPFTKATKEESSTAEQASSSNTATSTVNAVETPPPAETIPLAETIPIAESVPISASEVLELEAQIETVEEPAVVVDKGPDYISIGDGPDQLFFVFKEDCWLQVNDADGKVLYSALRYLGQTLTIYGRTPFALKVGNAPAVDLSLNGEPVEVRSRNSRKSASMTIGEVAEEPIENPGDDS